MKIKIIITILILFCRTAYAQITLAGLFEHKYFTNQGFGQIFEIEFLQKDSFHLNILHEQICYQRIANIKGLFKIKKDTLIIDLTFEKYLLNKKRTKFSSIEKKSGPTGYLIKVRYKKK